MTEETKITLDFRNEPQAKTNFIQPIFVPLEEYHLSNLQKGQQQQEELEEFFPQDLTSEKEAAIILKTIEQTGGASISVFSITWNLHGKVYFKIKKILKKFLNFFFNLFLRTLQAS